MWPACPAGISNFTPQRVVVCFTSPCFFAAALHNTHRVSRDHFPSLAKKLRKSMLVFALPHMAFFQGLQTVLQLDEFSQSLRELRQANTLLVALTDSTLKDFNHDSHFFHHQLAARFFS
jgi:hypothetical protein